MTDWLAEPWLLRQACGYARAAPEHRGKARALRSLSRILQPGGVWLRSPEGARFRADPAEYVGWVLLNTGAFEPQSLRLATRLMSAAPEHAFLDVGANQGLFTCAVGVGARCPVIAIEAAPGVFVRLQGNVAGNPELRATLVHACATPDPGLLQFFVPRDPHLAAWAGPRPKPSIRPEDLRAFFTGGTPLETILRGVAAPPIELMKIDVEGFELDVFAGLDWKGAFRPRHIIMECDPHERQKIEYLQERGYTARLITNRPIEAVPGFPEGNLWFQDSAQP